MGKRPKKVKRQLKAIADAFSLSTAVDSFALAFNPDEPRIGKGEKGGGQWTAGGRVNTHADAVLNSQREHELRRRVKTRDLHQEANLASEQAFELTNHAHAAPKGAGGHLGRHSAAKEAHIKAAELHRGLGDRERTQVHEGAADHHALYVRRYSRGTGLSHDPSGGIVFSLSHGEGDTKATKDPTVFWKEVAYAGTFFKGDQRIDITPRYLKHWEKTHRAMSKAGVEVPVPIEHTTDPEKRRGKVLELAARPNSRGIPALYAKIKFRNEKVAEDLKDSGTSIFVPDEAPSGLGKSWVQPVQHIAITDYPVIPNLEPFTQAIALSHSPLAVNPPSHMITERKGTAMSHQNASFVIDNGVLVMDAMSRPGARDGISLAFPPNAGEGKKEPDGDEKGSKDPAGATPPGPQNPAQAGNNPPSPNGATQKLTVQDLAAQLGIGQGVTDEQQLLTLLSNTIMQLKARAQAPMPPQPMPGQPPVPQQPGMPHPQMMPGQAPGQPMVPPRPPMPQGAYGPPAMHTGRPPVAMSKQTRKEFLRDLQQQQEEGISLSLEDIPQEIVMALSKKQMKKVIKTIKKAKGGVSGPKDVVQKLNDKSHFGMEEEGGDDTYECDNDSFGEEDIESEGEEEKKFNPSGMAAGGLSQLTGPALDAMKNARTVIIDDRFRRGLATAAVRKNLIDKFVEGQGVALSHHYDDGFNFAIAQLDANGPVLNLGKSGPQGAGVVALSNGELGKSPLEADADRRAEGRSSL